MGLILYRIEFKILLLTFKCMHARMCPSILEGTVNQTSQYKDSKIKHRYHALIRNGLVTEHSVPLDRAS